MNRSVAGTAASLRHRQRWGGAVLRHSPITECIVDPGPATTWPGRQPEGICSASIHLISLSFALVLVAFVLHSAAQLLAPSSLLLLVLHSPLSFSELLIFSVNSLFRIGSDFALIASDFVNAGESPRLFVLSLRVIFIYLFIFCKSMI